MFWSKNRIFRLRVGDQVIGLELPSSDYVKYFEYYFGVSSSPLKHDILLRISLLDHSDEIFVPHSIFIDKKTDGNSFIYGDNITSGSFSASTGRGVLNVKSGLLQAPIIRVFEQILYQAFYTITQTKQLPDILIHSSAVIYRGRGFIFAGPSGSGKSTVAALSEDYTVLNDEICLVTETPDGLYLNSTPFNGLYHGKKSGQAPLAAVILIAHGKSNRFVDIGSSEAVKVLAREIVPPVGLTGTLYPGLFADMLDYSVRLYNSVPVRKMEFLPDSSFWHLIDTEFFE